MYQVHYNYVKCSGPDSLVKKNRFYTPYPLGLKSDTLSNQETINRGGGGTWLSSFVSFLIYISGYYTRGSLEPATGYKINGDVHCNQNYVSTEGISGLCCHN